MKDNYIGFLVCNNCNGYYELQSGEFPDDFSECHCGGDLKYMESLDEKSNKNEFWRSWISGILLGFILIFCYIYLFYVLFII